MLIQTIFELILGLILGVFAIFFIGLFIWQIIKIIWEWLFDN